MFHSGPAPALSPLSLAPLIVIAGGGTGGHVFPGLAVAERLESAGARVAWLIAGGMERGMLESRGAKFFVAPFAPPRAIGIVYAWRLLLAALCAVRILLREKPGAVLSMGGYASLPGGLAAALLRLPLVVHEQNSVPGKATNLLRRFARRALGAFPDSPPQSETVGVPVAAAFHQFPPPSARYGARAGPLRLLVLGGSQGARDLNLAAPKALARIPQIPLAVTHQCGRGNLRETESAYADAGRPAEILEFTSEAPKLMAEADVVLCRAGASTLSELAAVGVAALLSPYPFAAANHQEKNADFFVDAAGAADADGVGGVEKIPSESEAAAARIAEFLSDATRESLGVRAAKMHSLARPQAAARAAEVCLQAAQGGA